MIKNERQYKITRAQARRLEQSLRRLADEPQTGKHPLLAKAELEALRSQVEELQSELSEYEALKDGTKYVFEIRSLQEFPAALIQARIASGLSQRELAERLDLKEQQIQRYEATDYASASISRLVRVADALGIGVQDQIILAPADLSATNLLERASEAGIEEGFLTERVVSPLVAAELEGLTSTGKEAPGLARRVASALNRSFGWPLPDLLSGEPLRPVLAGVAGFKAPAGANERRLQTYALYANTLALLALQAATELGQFEVPVSPADVRREIKAGFGAVTFENAVRYLWSKGVVVLPLHDPGAFHGACWRVGQGAAIALNQTTDSNSRWLFDALHELKHLLDANEGDYSYVEPVPISPERADSENEIEANNFAEDVMLDCRADEIAERCVERCAGRLELLKSIVPEVAAEEGVEADALANHLAFRLSEQGEAWWGAATNLQRTTPPPAETARRVMFANTDLHKLSNYDAELLLRSQQSRHSNAEAS